MLYTHSEVVVHHRGTRYHHGTPCMVPSWYTLHGTIVVHPAWYHHGTPCMVPSWYTLHGTIVVYPAWYHHGTPCMVPSWYTLHGTIMVHPAWYHRGTPCMVPSWPNINPHQALRMQKGYNVHHFKMIYLLPLPHHPPHSYM